MPPVTQCHLWEPGSWRGTQKYMMAAKGQQRASAMATQMPDTATRRGIRQVLVVLAVLSPRGLPPPQGTRGKSVHLSVTDESCAHLVFPRASGEWRGCGEPEAMARHLGKSHAAVFMRKWAVW